MTRVLGPETADRETVPTSDIWPIWWPPCSDRGYAPRSVLLYGPDPAGELVGYLRRDPVDLLVVGSHGHGLVRDLLLGQTVDRVRHSLERADAHRPPRPRRRSPADLAHSAGTAREPDGIASRHRPERSLAIEGRAALSPSELASDVDDSPVDPR